MTILKRFFEKRATLCYRNGMYYLESVPKNCNWLRNMAFIKKSTIFTQKIMALRQNDLLMSVSF